MNFKKLPITFFLVMACSSVRLLGQCGADIDFSTDWAKKGPAAAGNWTIQNSGSQVTQTINGDPTFYVSTDDYIDVRIMGSIRVNTTNDDDFVGFVFGYQNPDNPSDENTQKYYLFDWKQAVGANVGTHEGFGLIKVDSSLSLTTAADIEPLYWQHHSHPGFFMMDSLYGSGTGWADNTTYDFALTYTSKEITIAINSDTIFQETGCYEPGKFGFYNLSQDQVIYSNFSYELVAGFDISSPEACIGDAVNFNTVNDACQSGNYSSPIVGWSWDFGDGASSIETNSRHTYDTPGNYTVKLSVEDASSCVSTVQKNILVKGLLIDADKTELCKTDVANITATDIPGATYTWYMNGTVVPLQTTKDLVPQPYPGDFYATVSSAPEYTCNTTSNTITVTDGVPPAEITASRSTVCPGEPTRLSANTVSGATYDWFRNGSASSDSTSDGGRILYATTTGDYTVRVTAPNGCDSVSATLSLTSGTNPTVTLSSDVTDICPYETATLTVTTSASAIDWYKNNTLDSDLSGASNGVSQAGNYKVTVTNTDGCTATSSIVAINVKPQPDVTLTPSKPNLCPDVPSLELTVAEVNATYGWESSDAQSFPNAQTISATGDGIDYMVLVLGQNGCSDTSEVFTTVVKPAPDNTFSFPDTMFCADDNITLTATQTDADMYTWYLNGSQFAGSSTNNTTGFSATGDVYLVVEKDNCSAASDTVTFTETPVPDATVTSTSASFCPGDSVTLSVATNTGATYDWLMDNVSLGIADATNTLNVGEAGTYKATVTGSDGCDATSADIVVTQDQAPQNLGDVHGYSTYCPGDNNLRFYVDPVAGATQYIWEINPETSASIGTGQGTSEIRVNFLNAGTTTITCTAVNQCGASAIKSMSATKDILCAEQIQFGGYKTSICKGGTVKFSAYSTPLGIPPLQDQYRWEFSGYNAPASVKGTSATITFADTGVYDVTVYEEMPDGFGGTIDINSEKKYNYIHVGGSGTLNGIDGDANVNCGQTYTYTVSPVTSGSVYSWEVTNGQIISGAGTSEIKVKFSSESPATVKATENSQSGCETSMEKNIIVNAGAAITGIIGETNVSCDQAYTYTISPVTSGSTYSWEITNGTIISGDGTSAVSVKFSSAGIAGVKATETTEMGCVGSESINATVSCTGNGTGITSQQIDEIRVYPNPSAGIISINIPFEGEKTLMVFNSLGQLLSKEKTTKRELKLSLNEPAGVYWIRIELASGKIAIKRIVIKQI